MNDEFGQPCGEVRESIDGFDIYPQYGGFGYPQQGYSPKFDFNHQPKHYYENPPPTPRFSNYEESVGSNDTGCESSASEVSSRSSIKYPSSDHSRKSNVRYLGRYKVSEVTENNEENVPYNPQSPEGAPGKLYKYDMNKNIKKKNKECCIIL
uniref:Uncharacterized protein n=1 Tax=Meloidogyne floridensis TaxID=298350 RepID=A0A915NKB2_9BILA